MTYIKLNEENQTIEYPPINKGNICNYNLAFDLLEIDGYVNVADELIELFNLGMGKIIDGEIVDISQTPEYLAKKQLKENALKKTELQNQINELDIKRIRAICEPCQKDENTTWLEFYNTQILDLRKQISEL